MKEVLVYGSRKLSEMVYYDSLGHKDFKVAGLVRDREYIGEEDINMNPPIIPFDEVEQTHPADQYDMLVLTADFNKMRYRDGLVEKVKAKGYNLRNYISPKALVAPGTMMGVNNVVMEMAYIGGNGQLGDSNIIRQMVYIGHDFVIGDKNVFTPKVTIGGNARIGSNCYIGINATVLNKKVIGDEALIGGGAVVIKHIDSYSKNVGNPSRCIGYHEAEGLEVKL